MSYSGDSQRWDSMTKSMHESTESKRRRIEKLEEENKQLKELLRKKNLGGGM